MNKLFGFAKKEMGGTSSVCCNNSIPILFSIYGELYQLYNLHMSLWGFPPLNLHLPSLGFSPTGKKIKNTAS